MIPIKLTLKPLYFIVLIVLLLAATILKPFISTILAAMVLSYIGYPLYSWLNERMHKKSLSAMITTVLIVFLIAFPSFFAINALANEIFGGYLFAKQYLAAGVPAYSCDAPVLCDLLRTAGLSEPSVRNLLTDTLGKGTATIYSTLTQYIFSFPRLMAHVFVVVFLVYYLLKDGKSLVAYVKTLLPIRESHQVQILKRFNDVTYAVVYGNIIVALVQGVLTAIGFFLFGVHSPLIWGIVTMFTSLLPFLGAFVVWLPASLLLIISGSSSGESAVILRGVGLFLYGLLFISSIDNVLKPRIIGQRAKLHPALVLLGVIGGLSVFGVVGLVLGPVIIALAATSIELVANERRAS